MQDTSGCNIAAVNPYRYRGYYYDAEIGMYYLQSRYYNPALGRFVNADDSVILTDGFAVSRYNLLTYCENLPISFYDPTGNRLKNILGIAYYDTEKNIFYYRINAPQRKLGYCNAYDSSAGIIGIHIAWLDIRFNYDGKAWRIELWKGKYGRFYGIDFSSGAEIGIYTRKTYSKNGLYACASDTDCLKMSFNLYQKNKKLFSRSSTETDNYKNKHWWLTGFKPGLSSNPTELHFKDMSISFKSTTMANNFKVALSKATGSKSTGKAKNIRASKQTIKFDW